MPTQKTTTEKILAIVAALFLFAIVGSLFWNISVINKKRTLDLQKKVLEQRLAREDQARLDGVSINALGFEAIKAKSFLTIALTDRGLKKVLAERNPDFILPLASVSKLMTAMIVFDKINLETTVIATADYVGGDGTAFILEIGKTYKVKDLLANMLISSDNDSAQLLGSILGENNFVALMNQKAKLLGLKHTNFVNVTGLDPLEGGPRFNTSTATDLATLLWMLKSNYPEILKITRLAQFNFCDIENSCKIVLSTNQLLANPDFHFKIISGKTGQTDLALKNLVLLTELTDQSYLLNIVLGSTDHFLDTQNIINQVKIN